MFGIAKNLSLSLQLYLKQNNVVLLKIEIANVVVVQIHLCVPNIAFWVLKSCSHE